MSQSHFDPLRTREQLLGSTGFEWSLQRNFAQTKVDGGLAGTAVSRLAEVIQCLLVGFDEPAQRLLKMAAEWVQAAIDCNERPQRYFPDATEASRYETLALCNWLISNHHDTESLQHFVEYDDRYFDRQARKDKVDVFLTLVAYIDAGAFERTLEIFAGTRGLSPPTALAPRNEAQMAYIIARHHLELEYSPDDVRAATKAFLKRHIDSWLSNGHWVRADKWLKVVHWNDGDRSVPARQIVLKCYDYLPGRSFPN